MTHDVGAGGTDNDQTAADRVLNRNRDVRWDRFDPDSYHMVNYQPLQAADHKILVHLRTAFINAGVTNGRGLDVGTGANLYPSFAMLPFCSTIDMREYALPNVEWLRTRMEKDDDSWIDFWNVLAEEPAYQSVQPSDLRHRAVIGHGSIFDLEPGRWDIGTMFFVACSISEDMTEFDQAVRHFVRALKPGAPFATAYMLGSTGYDVNGVHFPAVELTAEDVENSLRPLSDQLEILVIDPLVRPGHTGMALATGRARAT
jgi:NNMT/PNMT/TEMT family